MGIYRTEKEARAARTALRAKLQKNEGYTALRTVAELPNVSYVRAPTGNMELDIDLGGGFPAGGLSIVTGPWGVGKTRLINKLCKQHQKLHGSQASILGTYTEFPPDHMHMRRSGLQVAVPDETIDQLQAARKAHKMPQLTKAEIRELKTQVGEFDVLVGRKGPDILNSLMEAYESKVYGIIFVDSLTMLQSKEELARKDLNDALKRAAHASMITEWLHQFHAAQVTGINNYTVTIATSQVRSKDKSKIPPALQKYVKDWDLAGAEALKHANLITLVLSDGQKIKKKKKGKEFDPLGDDAEGEGGDSASAEQLGKYMNWEIRKGKGGTHDGICGKYPYLYDSPTDEDVDSVILAASRYGVLRVEEDNSLAIYHGATGELSNMRFPDRQMLYTAMVSDYELELRIRYEVLAATRTTCVYRL